MVDLEAKAAEEIAGADYILVLLTPNLFNSEIWFHMIINAMGIGKRVIPVFLEKVDIDGTGLEKLKSLPTMNRTISGRHLVL